jgi:hypothetical protein
MKDYKPGNKDLKNVVYEEEPVYASREALEEARLKEAVNRTDTEKFRLFTKMMRIGMMLKKAKITHAPE